MKLYMLIFFNDIIKIKEENCIQIHKAFIDAMPIYLASE